MQLELDAFSGLPNPRWGLTRAQADEVTVLLGRLKPAAAAAPRNDGLGYRGFVVTADSDSETVDGCDEIRAYRGLVVARRGDRTETLDDPQRDLERWMLRAAAGHVAEPVLQYVATEIEGHGGSG